MPQVQFNLTKDQARVEVVLERASEEDKISYDELKQHFLESPFANHLPLEKGFQQALGKLLDTPPGEPTPATEVAQRTDAELRIVLSRNKFRASAEITQGHGGKKIRNMDVVVAARKAGVVQGLDTKAVGQLVAKAAEAAPGTVSREVIAEGREPVEGSDVRFEQLIPTLEDRATQPKEREDGSVDMKDYGKFLSVQEGQQLMRRHPAKPGQPGLSVLGKAIPCKAVKVGRMTPGTGTEISPDDPELLIATRSGIPRRLGHGFAQGMAVEQSLSLKAVNLASGHVEFEGTVMVERDVAEDMRVIASGDICVGGLVEASYLQAGGSVLVAKGMIGRQLQQPKPVKGKPIEALKYALVVKAEGDIRTPFVQTGDLTSGGSIYVDNLLYHSRVNARELVWVGKGEVLNGKLIGGEINAGTSVQAGIIGMPSGVLGSIDLSARLRQEQESIDRLRTEMNQVNEQEVKLAAMINSLLKRGVSNSHEKMQRLREAHTADHERVAELFKQLKESEAEFQRLLGEVRVVARQTLHAGVEIRLLDRVERIGRDMSAIEVRVTDQLGLEFVPMISTTRRQGKISKSRYQG